MFYFLSILCALSLCGMPAQSQVLEEAVTLESIYESRARSFLNSLVRPGEYSVAVSAELDRNKKKLDEYREDLDLRFLPGLPLPGSPEMFPETNMLHEMKSVISVHVILDSKVSPEIEEIVKKVLSSKLKLDLEGGDTLNLSRAPLVKEEITKPQILPDFTWKTWVLIVLIAALALAGFLVWLTRRREKQEEEEATKDRNQFDPVPHQFLPPLPLMANEDESKEDGDEGENSDSKADKVTASKEPEITPEMIVAETTKVTDLILSAASQYPALTSQALNEMTTSDLVEDVVTLCEHLGWSVSSKLFNQVTHSNWGTLGAKLRTRKGNPGGLELLESLSRSYRMVMGKILELGGEHDDENPFSFLLKISEGERNDLLASESASNLAMIGLFLKDQMADVMKGLAQENREKILVEMTRLEKLPAEAIRAASESVIRRLRLIQTNATVYMKGSRSVAQILKLLPADMETELVDSLFQNHPDGAVRLKVESVMFPDLISFPREIVSEALEGMETDVMVKALYGANNDFVVGFSENLPTKKANMVMSDVARPVRKPSPLEVGLARREIVKAVEQVMNDKKISLQSLYAQMGGTSGGRHLKAV